MQKTHDSQKQLAVLRDLVYSDLLMTLPVASAEQTDKFLMNLGLYAGGAGKLATPQASTDIDPFADVKARRRQYERLICDRFLYLQVSPDIDETKMGGWWNQKENRTKWLVDKYGDHLTDFAGFYREGSGRIKLNIPNGCVLYGYRSRYGLYNGILCQPQWSNGYYLLSSAKFGGPKALRLSDFDSALFDAGIVTFTRCKGGLSQAA